MRLASPASPVPEDCPLTARQLQIARMVTRGMTYRQVAAALTLGETTVRTHVEKVYGRLGLKGAGRGPLVSMMVDRGWADSLMPNYNGSPYAVSDQRGKASHWLPSPEQRLYLDAFDRLIRERTDEAALRLDIYFKVLCMTVGVPDQRMSGCETRQMQGSGGTRRVPVRDVDEMLLRLGSALTRRIPEPAELLAA